MIHQIEAENSQLSDISVMRKIWIKKIRNHIFKILFFEHEFLIYYLQFTHQITCRKHSYAEKHVSEF